MYPTAVELTAERRITLENDRQATMAKKAAAQEKNQANLEKLKERYTKEIQQYVKEKGKYQLAVQSLPQQDDTDAWKKVTMATLKTLVKWKRRKEDDKVPTTKVQLQVRWNETQNRCEMTLHERL